MANSKFHMFNINQLNYCMNCMTYEVISIPTDISEMLKNYIETKRIQTYEKDKILEFIEFINNNSLFFKEDIVISEPKVKKQIFSLCPEHWCNFKCRYCFAKDRDGYKGQQISNIIIDKIFSFMIEQHKECKSFRLEFVSGGEPLLNFDAVKYACITAEKYTRKYNICFEIVLVTNGSLFTDEILKYLDEHNVYMGISFEGTEEYQNKLRIMKNNANSYHTVIKNIKRITNTSEFVNVKKNLWTISVITKECNSLIDIIESNMKLGISSMELRIARGDEQDEIYLNAKNVTHFKTLYNDLYMYLVNEIAHEKYEVLFVILNNYDTFGKLIKKIICKNYVPYRCSAGVSKHAFTANGDIYPCDSFVGCIDFFMGNVDTNIINNSLILKKRNVSDRNPCHSCEFKYLCGGDCYYNSYINNGNYSICGEAYCMLMKHLCDLSIKIATLIKEEHFQKYKEIERYLRMRDIINQY